MSSEPAQSVMTDQPVSERDAFGELSPIAKNHFGQVSGGVAGGGFHSLLESADRERGFLSKSDRKLLLKSLSIDLADASQRSARQRIRDRVLSTYFDSRYLRYIAPRDRKIIFENARDMGNDLHFQDGLKEFVRFTHLGLLEIDASIDASNILEAAIAEAEREYATSNGENVAVSVDIDITVTQEDSVEDLERRFHARKQMSRQELATLVNSSHESDNVPESAADIDLATALYYYARQPVSDPHGYSWEDPDREEARKTVEELRDIFDKYDIKTYDDLDIATDRLSAVSDEVGSNLNEKLSRLPRLAPNFARQVESEANLSASDTALLHDILYNPDNKDVKTVLEEEARPRTISGDWAPSEDENLLKFVARVEANGRPTGGEEGLERWNEVLRLTQFSPDEWTEYMQDQRVQIAKDAIREVFEQYDDRAPHEDSGPPSEEEIEEAVNNPEYDLTREDFEEEFDLDRDPITNPPTREDLAGIRTADEFQEVFGRTHNTTEITFLEDEVGEEALAQALEELSEEWQEDSE